MEETDLRVEPNEASDLCEVLDGAARARRGWDRALLTVLDEAPAEEALAVLAHRAGHPPRDGWEAHRLALTPAAAAGRSEDAEACTAGHGTIYVLGSQFGSESGPLEASRSWIARLAEADVEAALDGERPELEIAWLRFALHRAVNDALAAAALELWPLGPETRAAYVDATIAHGAAKDKRWAGRVTSADHPINVEGAALRADGRMLLGLRNPVTADGHPILVELPDPDAPFEDPDAVPRCGPVWILEDVGSAGAPAGVRALFGHGDDRFDAVVGDLEAAGKSAAVIADHPEATAAPSRHVRFSLPLLAGGGAVRTEPVVDFGDVRRVEGVAVDGDGTAHYVVDRDGSVELRTLLVQR